MKLAIVAYPTLAEDDRQWIEAFRAKHDPQSTRLPAHFTLVFPVDTTPRILAAELRVVAESTQPISFALRRTEVVRDVTGNGAHIFLVPDDGRTEIQALHDRLYAGALRPHLRVDIPFIPHITIGAVPDLPSSEQLASELRWGSRIVRGSVSSMELVDVEQPLVRTVTSYRFGSH